MNNPNTPAKRLKRGLVERWAGEDYPGAQPRFQVALFAKDIAVFVLLPLAAVGFYKIADSPASQQRRPSPTTQANRENARFDTAKSQIIEFRGAGHGSSASAFGKRAPGSLVRLKLLNVVETYSTAPVHAQIVDAGLGNALMGGSLIGDAVPDTNFERINITFRYARDPNRESVAVALSARALSLDGTLGLEARKKEGFVTRSAIGSAHTMSQDAQGQHGNGDLKDILFRALTAGLVQELGSGSQVEKNRAQVLTLAPATEFFAELTDFFPSGGK